MQKAYLLAIDQGTTNSRAHIFTYAGKLINTYALSLTQYYPQKEWVEQNPEEMWLNTLECCRQVIKQSQLAAEDIAAVGITNQRETTILWHKKTGKPIYPAITWQDGRTALFCQGLANVAINKQVAEKTGLILNPYFSASKIAWILDHVPHAREQSEQGELLFGTVDTYLLWCLTKGKVHATDATNASRTLLFNIREQTWDETLLKLFNIPNIILPTVLDSSSYYGDMAAEFLGCAIPITSLVGDQQAALIGQGCFKSGMMKTTYGTGGFIVLNTGDEFIQSSNHLLSTIAYRLHGKVTYALEGSILCAGTIIKWLRDTLKIISTAAETETLAQGIDNTNGVYLVPAFTGLGAPYWDPYARAAIYGLTFNTRREHIVRAALEAIVYQTRDLVDVLQRDVEMSFNSMRVDGGMAANNWLLQFLADITGMQIDRPVCIETTGLGAAFLAGLHVGVYQSLNDITQLLQVEKTFTPNMDKKVQQLLYAGWKVGVNRCLTNNKT